MTVLNTIVDVADFTKPWSMRPFESTPAKQALYRSTLSDVPYPVQVIWGENDPVLTIDELGEVARVAAGLDSIHRLPGKHFLQENNADEVAELVAAFVADQSGND